MKEPKRIVSEAYDQIAERYLQWRASQPRDGELQRWLDLLRGSVQPHARVLDIGCGAGIPLTRALAEEFDVTGIDISPRQIELARRNVPAARFTAGDVTAADFAASSFDAVVASYSLIHIPRAEHCELFASSLLLVGCIGPEAVPWGASHSVARTMQGGREIRATADFFPSQFLSLPPVLVQLACPPQQGWVESQHRFFPYCPFPAPVFLYAPQSWLLCAGLCISLAPPATMTVYPHE